MALTTLSFLRIVEGDRLTDSSHLYKYIGATVSEGGHGSCATAIL